MVCSWVAAGEAIALRRVALVLPHGLWRAFDARIFLPPKWPIESHALYARLSHMHALGVPRRAATAQCRTGRPDGYAALHGPWRRERTKHPLGLVFACAHSALLAHGAISSVGVDAYGDRDAAADTTEADVSSQHRSSPVCLDHGAEHVARDTAAFCRLLCRWRMVHASPRTYGLGSPRRLA